MQTEIKLFHKANEIWVVNNSSQFTADENKSLPPTKTSMQFQFLNNFW
jgi:hypothetical protein